MTRAGYVLLLLSSAFFFRSQQNAAYFLGISSVPKSVLLRVTPKHSLKVVVFRSLKEMRTEFSRRGGIGGRHALAAFVAPRARITPRGRIINKVIGHILLVEGKFGAGVFAHELQHFVSWWCSVKSFDLIGKHWEYLPWIVGDITNRFWIWYYKEFDQ